MRLVIPLPLPLLPLALLACGGPGQQHPAVDGPTSTDGPATPDEPPVAAGDPAGDGPSVVTETTASIPGSATGRTLPATIYVPDGASHPLVVVSPGFQMARTQYASYAHHLATWGFVVVLTDYADTGFFMDHQTAADDITSVIDWAIANQPVDATKIATAGHSLGGKLSVFAATQDARIAAVVAWDPVDSNNPSVVPQKMTGLTAAIAVIGETTDGAGGGMPCAPTADNYAQFFASAPSPALSITVAGADHMDWVDDPNCTFCSFCTAGTIDAATVRIATRRLDVAWLRRRLQGDAAMDPWLLTPPEAALAVEQH